VDGLNGASPDGRWLAMFRSFTPHLIVHRLPDLERVAILTNGANIHSFEFSPAGDELAVSCRVGGVEFWSTTTWQRTRMATNLNHQSYSADGRTMWLTQQYRAGGLYDARTLKLLMPLPLGTYPLAVSPDNRYLAVSVDLRRLQVWDLVEVRRQLAEFGLDWRD
jgi:WD40 repeat protein